MSEIAAEETIVAISTPPGRGGIGIVRLSGPEAVRVASRLVRLRRPLEHGRARFTRVMDPSAEEGAEAAALDEAVVTAFLAPHSYTGEDVVEIAAHGSPVVLEALLSGALRLGARLAEPGEFTQRAFLSGRLDLTQAEAVQDLIAARTLEQAKSAAQQLGGALSRRVAPAKEALLQLIALLEAGMDFASGELDDVDVVPAEQIDAAVAEVRGVLEGLARSFRAGSLLRSGVSLALVGRPNAGKSSLFNRLLERPRAIVTAVPGTTRDTLEEAWSLQGIPVRLVDTAGLRLDGDAPVDEAERLGMERSREALADADLVLLVHDATVTATGAEVSLAEQLEGRPYLLVRNKVDLLTGRAEGPAATARRFEEDTDELARYAARQGRRVLEVSALEGQGLMELQQEVLAALQAHGNPGEAGALNTRRQQESVTEALAALGRAQEANRLALPHEVVLLDLHSSLRALDELTGVTTVEDVLGRIFSTFCIGK